MAEPQASNDPQDNAEQLDADALGEQPDDDRLPGVNDFAEPRRLASEDPALIDGGSETQDDLRTREWRERPDGAAQDGAPAIRLSGPSEESAEADADTRDRESRLVGDAEPVRGDDASAEESAIRIDTNSGDRNG